MDIVNPDFSHTSFLNQADSDINSAKILLGAEKYSQAIYFFQQSVEKSCKYLGLTIKAFNYKQLRKISHEPEKVFDTIFHNEIMTLVSNDNYYDKLKDLLFKQELNERAYAAYCHIEEAFNIKDSEHEVDIYSEQVITFYENNLFNKLLPTDLIHNIKIRQGIPKIEELCKNLLSSIKNLEKCILCQMLMSFLVGGVEANSRYPDYDQDTTPDKIYSEESEIIQNLSYFIEKQIFCIQVLRDYFKNELVQ